MRRIVLVSTLFLVAACQSSPSEPVAQQPGPLHQFVLFFHDGGAALTDDGRAIVDQIAAAAHKLRPQRIEVIGSNDGLAASHQRLADRRATTVAQALAKDGIDPAIITEAGQVRPAGGGVAAHEVVVRFHNVEGIAPAHQIAEGG